MLNDAPEYHSLSGDVQADVLIIGGGITGMTAAYLLAKAGKHVVLLEKRRLAGAETLHTTAHISYPTDMRLQDLVKDLGRDHAQAVWEACQASADEISRLVREEDIACHWGPVPGYLYAAESDMGNKEIPRLKEESSVAQEMGFDAAYVESCPVAQRPALRFANLQKFHPMLYLHALAKAAAANGVHLCENSEVKEFGEDGQYVICNGHRVRFRHVLIATHVPLQGNAGTLSAAILQTKIAGYSTYAVSARLPGEDVAEGLWWDTEDPYFYFRIDRDPDAVRIIAGGEDHKTGTTTDTEGCYTRLVQKLHTLFPDAIIEKRWSGQVIETVDGLPYIGFTKEQFIATGFSGTGMTFGTLAAMMFRDHVMQIQNPWENLFAPERKKLAATWDYLRENKDYPYYLVKGLLTRVPDCLSEVAKGEGAVIRHQDQKVAVYRNESGGLTLLSAVCPHLGCIVGWNQADKTWDCPCHGSRFAATGEVICGPAESALPELKD